MMSPNDDGSTSPRPAVFGVAEGDDGEEDPEDAARALLRQLLARPAPELAAWALEQARALAEAGAELEQTEAFRLAGALRDAGAEDKKVLARNAVAGFGELPAHRRAEALRLGMQAADIAQRVGGAGVRQLLAEHAGAVQHLAGGAAPTPGAPDAAPPPPPPPRFGGAAESGDGDRGSQDWEAVPDAPPLVRNLLRLADEARVSEMPQRELSEIAEEVRTEAVHLADPQQLADVVAELRPDEREQLTDTLVEVKVVPEEQRGLLREAVRPGGYADRIASAMKLLGKARKKMWIFALLPAAELLLALLLGSFSCGTSLLAWLRGDSIIALGQVGCLYFAYYVLAPAYRQVQYEPMGALQRWKAGDTNRDLWARLEEAVPGVAPDTWRMGGASLLTFAVLSLLGAMWLLVGMLELMGTMAYGCSSVILFFCNLLIGLRLVVATALLLLVAYRIWTGSPMPQWMSNAAGAAIESDGSM